MIFNGLFQEKKVIFKKKDRESWEQIREIVKKEKLSGVFFHHYDADVVRAGGCGAKLDPRDFGQKGKIDHDIYLVKVVKEQEQNVLDVLHRHGLVPVIDEEASIDAAVKLNLSEE